MTIDTATFTGAPLGSNLAAQPHEIPDTHARYIQDAFVDHVGIINERGPVKVAQNGGATPTYSSLCNGLVYTYRPDGAFRLGVMQCISVGNKEPSALFVLASPFTSNLASPLNIGIGANGANHYLVNSKPCLGGGTIIGYSINLTGLGTSLASPQALIFWQGAAKAIYSTGTVTCTATSAVVTGAGTTWTTNLEPGMFLFADTDSKYLGCIKSVDTNTQVTLVSPPGWAVAGVTYQAKSIRGAAFRYSSGLVSTTTTSAIVTGADTRFKANIDSTPGNWRIHRASTMEFVGTVSSVQANDTLTLTGNAAVALDEEPYVAIQSNFTGTTIGRAAGQNNFVGFLTEAHKFRQWYANAAISPSYAYRLWFSEIGDAESIDFDPELGNFIEVTSSTFPNAPIVALASAEEALLVLKENETFVLRGDTPEQFSLSRLSVNDGTLSTMSVQKTDEGIIYAGRNGLYLFDGVNVTNVVGETLDKYYRDLMSNFDPTTYRMWSMVADRHYFLFLENANPSYTPIKGSTASTVTALTIAVNLTTMAVTFHTNLDIRGSVQMPAFTKQGTWFLTNNNAAGANLCSSLDLRSTAGGRDTLLSVSSPALGPDFYLESKRYDVGDALRKKLFKEILLTYSVVGDTLSVDTITGLNDTGTTSSSTFPASSTFQTKRLKFLKRDQLFGFRIYGSSSAVTNVRLGPWALGFKLQRLGRP